MEHKSTDPCAKSIHNSSAIVRNSPFRSLREIHTVHTQRLPTDSGDWRVCVLQSSICSDADTARIVRVSHLRYDPAVSLWLRETCEQCCRRAADCVNCRRLYVQPHKAIPAFDRPRALYRCNIVGFGQRDDIVICDIV